MVAARAAKSKGGGLRRRPYVALVTNMPAGKASRLRGHLQRECRQRRGIEACYRQAKGISPVTATKYEGMRDAWFAPAHFIRSMWLWCRDPGKLGATRCRIAR